MYKLSIVGNACELIPTGYYDRVYCGAAVPLEESEFMKSLIKVLYSIKYKNKKAYISLPIF